MNYSNIPAPKLKWEYMCDHECVGDHYFPFYNDPEEDDPDEFVEYAYVYVFGYHWAIDRRWDGKWIVLYSVFDGPEVDFESKEFDVKDDAFSFSETMWESIWVAEMGKH